MNDIRGGRVTSYMIDIRYSAVTDSEEVRSGSSKLGQRPKGATWEIFTPAIVLHSNNNPALLAHYGHALAISGNKNGARRALAELQGIAQHQYVPSLYFAGIYVGLGEKDEAFKWLEKAYQERHDRLVYLGVDPMADPLRSDARFHELMKKVGLP
jgi:hypothetical protein